MVTATAGTTTPAKEEKKGLSTGAKVGIGVAAVFVVGGVIFLLVRKRKKAGRRR